MSQSNIEFLFQITAPTADRALGVPGKGGADQFLFGDHLASVASPTEPIRTLRGDSGSYDRPSDSQPSTSPTPSTASAPAAADTSAHSVDHNDTHDEPVDPTETAVNETDQPADHDDVDAAHDDDTVLDEVDDEATDAVVASQAASATTESPAKPAAKEITAAIDRAEALDAGIGPEATNHPDGESSDDRRAARLAAARAATEDAQLKPDPVAASTTTEQVAIDGDGSKSKKPASKSEKSPTDDARILDSQHSAKTGQQGDATATTHSSANQVATHQALAPQSATTEPADTSEKDADGTRRSRNSQATSRVETIASATKDAATALTAGAITTDIAKSTGESNQDTTQVAKQSTAKADALHPTTGRVQHGTATTLRPGKSDGGDDLPRVDAGRFVGRVAKAFQTAQERGGTLNLRLSPPELGSVRLELTVKDGVMTAALETETATARRVLLDHLPALRDRLAEQNIRVERFDVDVRRDGSNGQADPRAFQDQQQPNQGQPDPRRRPAVPSRAAETARPVAAPTPQISNSAINVIA